MVRRRKQSSGNLMPLSVPNPTLLTFLGTSQPGSDAKRVTFNEMNAVSNDDILKRLLALETKVDSIGTTTGTTDVSALTNRISKIEAELKTFSSTGTTDVSALTDRIGKIEGNISNINNRLDIESQTVTLFADVGLVKNDNKKYCSELIIYNDKLSKNDKLIDTHAQQHADQNHIIIEYMGRENAKIIARIEEIEKKLPPATTTAGKYDSQIQHLIGGTWY
jgi:hypothetical protein